MAEAGNKGEKLGIFAGDGTTCLGSRVLGLGNRYREFGGGHGQPVGDGICYLTMANPRDLLAKVVSKRGGNLARISNRSGDERDEVEEKKAREFMAKYMANYRAHRKGMSPEEVSDYYSHWAENMKYDQDLNPGTYNGPTIIADEMADCYPENRDKIKIMDIACGTGRVGDELSAYGFKDIDGLDPSEGMLKQCKSKGLYKNLYKEFCCDKTLPIDDDIYDCLVVAGGMGESHIPCSGILEMMRIVKQGGLILIVMRKEYLKYVGEYVDRLEPFLAKLERENKMEMIERREVTNYSFDREGVLFKLKVKKNGV